MQLRYTIIGAVLLVMGSTKVVSAQSDPAFLTDAIQVNLAEISVGDLAQKNGGSDDVKSFGKMLVEDHTASNTKATSLAQANGITPPTEPNAAEKKMHDELAKLSGREFDREFAKAMVKGHEDAIAKFEAAASKGDDDVAKFAQETLQLCRNKVSEKGGDRYLVINATKEALEKAPGYVYDQVKGVWVPATKER
jgi:putative membrane protein